MSGINIYCDESTHLENDGQPYLVLGGVSVPTNKVAEVNLRLKEIKAQHSFHTNAELKWTKASPNAESLYRAVIDYFFDDDDLGFRCVLARKDGLDLGRFGIESYDGWYYRMYFELLKRLIRGDRPNYIYLDIKDTRSAAKVHKLHEVLANDQYDFDRTVVRRVQTVRSNEVQLLQVADLLIGALNYHHREAQLHGAKGRLVDRIIHRSGRNLKNNSLPSERKFNIFHWTPRP